jgi:hypothetical protein
VYLLRSWEKDEGLPHARAAGRAVAEADRTLVRILLPNGCAFCLEWRPSITVVRYWSFPVLTDVTDGISFSLAVTVALMATVTVRWPPSTRVYIRRRWDCFLLRENTRTNILRRVVYSPSLSHLLRAQIVWESRPPKSPSAEWHLHGCASDQVFGERTRDL